MHLGAINRLPDLLILRLRQHHFQRPHIRLQILNLLRARYREYILALVDQPREGQLAGCTALPLPNFLQLFHQLQVLGEVFVREARG